LQDLKYAFLNRAGTAVLGRPRDGDWRIVPLDGGRPHTPPGLARSDQMVGWGADDRSVFVQRGAGRFERVDLGTGRTLQSVGFGPSERTGLNFLLATSVTGDGSAYAYSYYQRLSRAFRVSGVLR
jgi:hypothetical protein